MPAPESSGDLVYALALAPDGAVFAARESGLYRSDDAGSTWHSIYDSLHLKPPLTTTALALSPDFGQDRSLFAGVSGSLLRSTDAGQHWHALPLPDDQSPLISSLALSPNYSADSFVIATSFTRGVFYSLDRGETWFRGNYSLLDPHILVMALSPHFTEDHRVLIGTETGVFSSSNGARSWEFLDLPYIPVPTVAFAPDETIYAGTDGDGMYVSSDNGRTWTRSTLEPTLSINLILTSSTGELLVFADETLYRSSDGGATWRTLPLPASATAAVLLNSARLLVGYADGSISGIDLSS